MSSKIEYQYTEGKIGDRNTPIPVRLDGKSVGTIKPVEGGWQYFPLNSKKGGEIFATIDEVQKSLHEEEETEPYQVADYLESTTGKRYLAVWAGHLKDGDKGHPLCLITPKETETEQDRINAYMICEALKMMLQKPADEMGSKWFQAYKDSNEQFIKMAEAVHIMKSALLGTLKELQMDCIDSQLMPKTPKVATIRKAQKVIQLYTKK